MKSFLTVAALIFAAISFGSFDANAQTPVDNTTMNKSKPMAKASMEPTVSILAKYLLIQKALATDSLKGVSEASTQIADLVEKDTMKMFPAAVATEAKALAKMEKIADARKGFATLSATLIPALQKQKMNTGMFFIASCPMANASWIQDSEKISNPYYGSSMATCGTIKGKL